MLIKTGVHVSKHSIVSFLELQRLYFLLSGSVPLCHTLNKVLRKTDQYQLTTKWRDDPLYIKILLCIQTIERFRKMLQVIGQSRI